MYKRTSPSSEDAATNGSNRCDIFDYACRFHHLQDEPRRSIQVFSPSLSHWIIPTSRANSDAKISSNFIRSKSKALIAITGYSEASSFRARTHYELSSQTLVSKKLIGKCFNLLPGLGCHQLSERACTLRLLSLIAIQHPSLHPTFTCESNARFWVLLVSFWF